MLTFDHVLNTFLEYLSEDSSFEVVRIAQGYLCLAYDSRRDSWYVVRLCANPRALRETLLEAYEKYQRFRLGQADGAPHRELTVQEETSLREQLEQLAASSQG